MFFIIWQTDPKIKWSKKKKKKMAVPRDWRDDVLNGGWSWPPKGSSLVDHFIVLERSKQILSVLRFIKLRICSVGSWSVALNRNVCQFHLASHLAMEIYSRVDGYFPCDISQPERPFLGNIPNRSRKQFFKIMNSLLKNGDRKFSL